MRVAVIGLGHSHKDAPWTDSSWEKWCLSWDPCWEKADRLFQMHDLDYIEDTLHLHPDKDAANRHRTVESMPVYMREQYFPHVTRYPLEDVIKTIGRDYFESSIAFMFALAIHEGFEEIGMWGVGMKANTEYAYQRPNMEWLLGLARGRGIKIYMPESTPLLKFNGGKPAPRFKDRIAVRYGQWDEEKPQQ